MERGGGHIARAVGDARVGDRAWRCWAAHARRAAEDALGPHLNQLQPEVEHAAVIGGAMQLALPSEHARGLVADSDMRVGGLS